MNNNESAGFDDPSGNEFNDDKSRIVCPFCNELLYPGDDLAAQSGWEFTGDSCQHLLFVAMDEGEAEFEYCAPDFVNYFNSLINKTSNYLTILFENKYLSDAYASNLTIDEILSLISIKELAVERRCDFRLEVVWGIAPAVPLEAGTPQSSSGRQPDDGGTSSRQQRNGRNAMHTKCSDDGVSERKRNEQTGSRLDAEAARRFVMDPCSVDLSEMTAVDTYAADALAQHRGILALDSLRHLSVEAAEALAKTQGTLVLNGLTDISVEVAETLAKTEGSLVLNGLKCLSTDVAVALAGHIGRQLTLNGLTDLSVALAEAIAGHFGQINLKGLLNLSVEAAEALALHSGSINLNGLTTLSLEVATALSGYQGKRIFLDGVANLSTEVAKALAEPARRSFCWMYLTGLTELSEETAEALSRNYRISIPKRIQR